VRPYPIAPPTTTGDVAGQPGWKGKFGPGTGCGGTAPSGGASTGPGLAGCGGLVWRARLCTETRRGSRSCPLLADLPFERPLKQRMIENFVRSISRLFRHCRCMFKSLQGLRADGAGALFRAGPWKRRGMCGVAWCGVNHLNATSPLR
jgi:hypothetical protein